MRGYLFLFNALEVHVDRLRTSLGGFHSLTNSPQQPGQSLHRGLIRETLKVVWDELFSQV
jgi:hypothetical protein